MSFRPILLIVCLLANCCVFGNVADSVADEIQEIFDRHQAEIRLLLQSEPGLAAPQADRELVRQIFLRRRTDERQSINIWPTSAELARQLDPDPASESSLPASYRHHPLSQLESEELATLIQDANRQFASRLYQLVIKEIENDHGAVGYQLLHDVLFFDPDHAESRRVLGYRSVGGDWARRTRSIASRSASGRHALTGWPARRYLQIDSANYRLVTMAEENRALAVVHELERTYSAWRQLFFRYWGDARTVSRWINGNAGERPGKLRHQVVLCRDRDEYQALLTRMGVTGGEASTGYYSDRRKTMFIYLSEHVRGSRSLADVISANIERTTRYQEQAHQLFQEVGGASAGVGEAGNIWAVEAVAMYFESLSQPMTWARDGNIQPSPVVEFGGIESQRLQYARLRANRQGLLVPLQQLARVDRQSFQTDPNVMALYSQSAGLAHFFMTTAGGQYRNPFLDFIKLLYEGKAREGSLEEACGLPAEQIDAAYRKFLVPDTQRLKLLTEPELRTELALGASSATNEQIAILQRCPNLRWLQLSGTQVDDGCCETVGELMNLQELFVDQTAVGDAFVRGLGKLVELQQLDLANTRITGQSLPSLENLHSLDALWLAGTEVDDEGLFSLAPLKKLSYLDVRQTKVTASGIQRFQRFRSARQLPDVQFAE